MYAVEPHLMVTSLGKDRISALLSTERLQTRVYNDNKDFRAIITEVYICKIYTTIKQGYI